MKNICLLFCTVILLFSCKEDENTYANQSLIHAVPVNATLILESKNFQETLNQSLKGTYGILIKEMGIYKNIKDNFEDFKQLFTKDITDNSMIISISSFGKKNFKPLYILSSKDTLKFNQKPVETFTYNNTLLEKFKVDSQTYIVGKLDKFNFISTEKLLIEEGIRQLNSYFKITDFKEFKTVYKTLDNDADLNVIINFKEFDHMAEESFPFLNVKGLNSFSMWQGLDFEFKESKIKGHGVSYEPDSINSYVNIFKNIPPTESELWSKIPDNFSRLKRTGTFNFSKLQNHYNSYLNSIDALYKRKRKLKSNENLIDDINNWFQTEWVNLAYEKEFVSIIKTKGVSKVEESIYNYMEPLENTAAFKGYPLYKIKSPEAFKDVFLMDMNNKSELYALIQQDYLYLASSLIALKSLINEQALSKTLDQNEPFNDFIEEFSTKNNQFTIYNRANYFKSTELKAKKWQKQLKNLNYIGFQLKTNGNYIETLIEADFKSEKDIESQSDFFVTAWKNELSQPIIYGPEILTNYKTKEKFIIVQDQLNTIHFFNSDGNKKWSKEIDGRIISPIYEGDIYNNGRIQLVFNTEKNIYWIPTNGKGLKGFPYLINTGLPIAFFDYDKNRKNRIVIVDKHNRVKMIDKTGTVISGYQLKKLPAGFSLIHKPQHFKIRGKDYILYTGKTNIILTNRVGNIVKKLEIEKGCSAISPFLENNKISILNKAGEVYRISTDNFTTEKVKIGSHIRNLIQTKDYQLIQTKNKIKAIGKNSFDYKLDEENQYSITTKQFKDDLYTLIIDKSINEAILLDKNGKILKGFPVYANQKGFIYKEGAKIKVALCSNDGTLSIYQK